jgi:hypothetical protein
MITFVLALFTLIYFFKFWGDLIEMCTAELDRSLPALGNTIKDIAFIVIGCIALYEQLHLHLSIG